MNNKQKHKLFICLAIICGLAAGVWLWWLTIEHLISSAEAKVVCYDAPEPIEPFDEKRRMDIKYLFAYLERNPIEGDCPLTSWRNPCWDFGRLQFPTEWLIRNRELK